MEKDKLENKRNELMEFDEKYNKIIWFVQSMLK